MTIEEIRAAVIGKSLYRMREGEGTFLGEIRSVEPHKLYNDELILFMKSGNRYHFSRGYIIELCQNGFIKKHDHCHDTYELV